MTKNKFVYIIDDDPIVLAIGKKLIDRHQDYDQVSTATNGEEALQVLKGIVNQNLPSFILLDLNMPIMDGWEFLDNVQNIDHLKDIPIFIFTSSINPVDKQRSLNYANVRGYISKPLTMSVLDNIGLD
jgi:CheY-like chemotaxis protein